MSTPYEVRRSEGSLWTTGFSRPDGRWEPESDHDNERAAKTRAWRLNGVESRFVYVRSEPGLWTVGEYCGTWWEPEGDYDREAEAADRVIALNS